MDVRNFVKNSLLEIFQGINDAKKELSDKSVSGTINNTDYTEESSHLIEFDIAVTVSESDKKDVDGKLSIASILSTGGSMEKSSNHNVVSRIKFSIPVTYPQTIGPMHMATTGGY
ncbi:hypothetical protein ACE38W_14750 [Chitinophaga sp. Hz27]|uniref:hypothetical protein n=1 Tax=Chitinophaga sp. Hz27 TaxID=3347169 RepID=UPI0035E1E2B4